jgi:uncharacterized protein (DUF1684 family)
MKPVESLDNEKRDELSDRQFTAEWERWHLAREERLASPLGFLAITGLHWLRGEPERFNDAPGVWSATGDGVDVELGDGEVLTIDDNFVTGRYHFDDVDEHGTWAHCGDTVIEVALRDGQFMIRPRDPHHDVRARYTGTPTYAANREWAVPGIFLPYEKPRTITVGASIEGLEHVFQSSGDVAFELSGQELRLIAFDEEETGELSFIFSDLTSGVTTYPACRFLTVSAAREDGRVNMDFNRATNPMCAYTEFATCPLPPAGNRLPVSVEAGEKVPASSH